MTEPLLRVENLVKHFPLRADCSGGSSTACTRSTA